jgi:diguanylate cyclase
MAREYDAAAAAGCLRMALPLMSEYGVPATPTNYAVWYEYVAGQNASLKQHIDERIAANQTVDAELTAELHKAHVAEWDEARLETARKALLTLSETLGGSMSKADGQMEAYQASLVVTSSRLAGVSDAGDLRTLVGNLAEETATIRESGAQLREMLEESRREAEALRQELAQAREEATTDPLTGLPNRKAFDATLEDLFQQFHDDGQAFSLIIGDIDHFKSVNDTHGHLVGDKVIRYVGSTMRKCAKGRDLVARLGGEEYAVLLPDTELSGAIALAEDIRRNVEAGRLVRTDNRQCVGVVTISMGVSCCRADDGATELIARADEALYRAKGSSRNQVVAEQDDCQATGTTG